MSEKSHKSTKSNSEFTVSGEKDRAYLVVSGEAATKPKVIKEIERIRREGADFATVDWTARMLANTF